MLEPNPRKARLRGLRTRREDELIVRFLEQDVYKRQPITSSTYVIYIFSFVAGGLEGLMWILWGESLTRARANFSVVHIGTTFGATVLVVMIVSPVSYTHLISNPTEVSFASQKRQPLLAMRMTPRSDSISCVRTTCSAVSSGWKVARS